MVHTDPFLRLASSRALCIPAVRNLQYRHAQGVEHSTIGHGVAARWPVADHPPSSLELRRFISVPQPTLTLIDRGRPWLGYIHTSYIGMAYFQVLVYNAGKSGCPVAATSLIVVALIFTILSTRMSRSPAIKLSRELSFQPHGKVKAYLTEIMGLLAHLPRFAWEEASA
ncbi:hypothetical protein DEU56DRAFT_819536 [Suillus clintonianus]|uniref:uncharacterized protein n=1 Tax=Suillus clintonianus TaxID=1904413 RepID=UPI001B86308A|nr:uncharacterized protein DEU56DRAFT_819536 [Suillus clintonianus]KAG2128289.1 hypothetical protein DEU56DRAFT_819536 [Suillus clintonianus]